MLHGMWGQPLRSQYRGGGFSLFVAPHAGQLRVLEGFDGEVAATIPLSWNVRGNGVCYGLNRGCRDGGGCPSAPDDQQATRNNLWR